MAYSWKAEKTIDPEDALAIVADQFPQLNPKHIKQLGIGWDNTAYLINDEYVFRFPRREVAVPLLSTEYAILPTIAPLLPLEIPLPKWFGKPTESYPWPFCGYRKLLGITGCHANLSDADRIKLAKPIANFLKSLHAIPVTEEMGRHLHGDLLNRLKIEKLITGIRKDLDELTSLGLLENRKRLNEITDAAEGINFQRKTILVHGDIYIRHLLVNEEHELTGVIDWGDLHLGDHAVDLAIAHSFLPLEVHQLFRATYGDIDPDSWRMARLRALYHSAILSTYGYHSKDAIILREGLHSLKQINSQDL